MQKSLFLLILLVSLALFFMRDIIFSYSPDSQSRIISIRTELKGSYQEGIEELITNPLEGELSLLDGIKSINSVSEDEQSIITIYFEDRMDLGKAYLKVRDTVDRISAVFPEQTQKPVILKSENDAAPVFLLMLENRNLYDEESLKKMFQGIPGAGQVDVAGAPAKDVILNSHPEQLSGYGYNSDRLAGELASNNRIVSLSYRPGYPLTGDFRSDSLEDLGNRLLQPGIHLYDIAAPIWQNAPVSTMSSVNGSESVLVRVRKAGDANTIQLCHDLRVKASELTSVQILYDKGKAIEDALMNTVKAIGIGVICVFIITGLFLGSWRNALILSGNIPFSVLCSLALLNQMGRDIDMMVLAGTAVGIGLLIDGGVIVLESGFEKSRRAVFFSLISTIIAFTSLIFAPITVREKYLGMVYSVSTILFFSIIYIFRIMPGLLYPKKNRQQTNIVSNILVKFQSTLFKYRYLSLVSVLFFCVVNFYLALQLPLMQKLNLNDNSLGFNVEYPSGTSRKAVREDLKKLEQALNEYENINYFSTEYKTEKGSFFVQMEKGHNPDAVLKQFIKNESERLLGSVFFLEEPETISYDITLSAYKREALYAAADDLSDRLRFLVYSQGIIMHYKKQQDIVSLNFDSDKISDYGLTPVSVFRQVSSLLNRPVRLKWIPPSEILKGQNSYDIRITEEGVKSYNRQNLLKTVLYTKGDTAVRINQFTNIDTKENFGRIYHNNGVRTVSLSVALPMKSLSRSIDEIQKVLDEVELPEGIRMIHGENLIERKLITESLLFCTLLSMILVILFLIFVFESFRIPIFLFLQLPAALLFPVPVLLLLNIPLSAPVFFGLILVIGVSVNNGIVLFNGMKKEQINISILASMYEKHAISLLTAFITTLASVFPLLFSGNSGGSFLTGLSITVCFGLMGSLLTLLLLTPLLVKQNGYEIKTFIPKQNL